MHYFVERIVPSKTLLMQGIYTQTCAHIELVAWRIVQMIEGVDPSSLDEIEAYLKLKLNTRGIVSRLKSVAFACHAPLGIRVLALAHRVEAGLPNRNMAAHGAWRLHTSGTMEVEHYHRGKDRTFRFNTARYSDQDIANAVEDADHLLREAVDLHDTLLKQRRRFLTFDANTYERSQFPENAPSSKIRPPLSGKPAIPKPRLARLPVLLWISTTLGR